MTTYYKQLRRQGILEKTDAPHDDGLTVCIGPSTEELQSISDVFKTDMGMLHDATDLYETPRIDHYGKNIYLYTRYCRPENRETATEPITLVITPKQFILLLRQESPFVKKILKDKQLVQANKTLAILKTLEMINYTYRDYLFSVSRQVLAIRGKLNKHDIDNKDFIAFIDIEEDLNEIIGSLQPHSQILRNLAAAKIVKLNEAEADLAEDLELSTTEMLLLADTRKVTIASTREAYSTIMANNLNKTFKKLTSISIFMTIPTITSGLYGMNLILPLAKNKFAFWWILLVVMSITTSVIWLFKRMKWL